MTYVTSSVAPRIVGQNSQYVSAKHTCSQSHKLRQVPKQRTIKPEEITAHTFTKMFNDFQTKFAITNESCILFAGSTFSKYLLDKSDQGELKIKQIKTQEIVL